jgi:hypothetical protein
MLTRRKEYITWFEPELTALQSAANASINIHVTSHTFTKADISAPIITPTSRDSDAVISSHPGKEGQSLSRLVTHGRPQIQSTLEGACSGRMGASRMLVASCGPRTLSDDVRRAVKVCMSGKELDIDLRVEAFDW